MILSILIVYYIKKITLNYTSHTTAILSNTRSHLGNLHFKPLPGERSKLTVELKVHLQSPYSKPPPATQQPIADLQQSHVHPPSCSTNLRSHLQLRIPLQTRGAPRTYLYPLSPATEGSSGIEPAGSQGVEKTPHMYWCSAEVSAAILRHHQ